jgi:hypothetical protein
VLEDWLWFAVFPLGAYAALVVAAIMLPRNPAPAFFGVGAVTVFLLFIGIHNAWDAATYTAADRPASDGAAAGDDLAEEAADGLVAAAVFRGGVFGCRLARSGAELLRLTLEVLLNLTCDTGHFPIVYMLEAASCNSSVVGHGGQEIRAKRWSGRWANPSVRPHGHESSDHHREQWMLYQPPGHVLTVRADGRSSRVPGDTAPGQEDWQPLSFRWA